MRRFMILVMAGAVALGMAGPVSAGANVSNTSGSGQTIYGDWSSEDTYGSIYLGNDSTYGAFGDVYVETGQWVPCDGQAPEKGAAVPADATPGDEYHGFVGTRTWGSADGLTIQISRRLETGTASGSIVLYTSTVDECNGVYGDPVESVGTLEVSVTGTGPIVSYRWTSHYKVPDQFSGHDNYRAKERAVSGSLVAGGQIDTEFTGYMSQVTWSAHAKE